jgi:spore coat polysaccharide biosynthesis predicted glycosyltransferase SpsG
VTLAVIPARGGSVELKRKNLLPDADGTPLVLIAARAAVAAGCRVIISTDDPEIASVGQVDGHQVLRRGPELAEVLVDEVVRDAATRINWTGDLLLVQPTVQPMTATLLRWFLNHTGGEPTALGVEERHLLWWEGRILTGRHDRRSDSTTWPIREVGVRWWPAQHHDTPPVRVATWPHPLTDIDTIDDYRTLAPRLTVVFNLAASKNIGAGHLYRCLTLAEGMQQHQIYMHPTRDTEKWAVEILEERGWPMWDGQHPDVWVNDRLDTQLAEYLPGIPTVTLEDRGPGAVRADAVVNDMYGDPRDIPPRYSGARYAVLRPEFTVRPYQVKAEATQVAVLFGGTDPARLTELAVEALKPLPVFLDVIRPEDRRSVAAAMHDADLLLTSGGRTLYEAAAVGVPAVVLCQNQRETTHTHLGIGNINLGLGRLVTPEHLRHTVTTILGDPDLRGDMSVEARRSVDGGGADRVRRIIEHAAG